MDIPDENGILGTESKMTQVTMKLTDEDIERVKYLCDVLRKQNKAYIVSIALVLTTYIVAELLNYPEAKLVFINGDGTCDRLLMDELSVIPALQPKSKIANKSITGMSGVTPPSLTLDQADYLRELRRRETDFDRSIVIGGPRQSTPIRLSPPAKQTVDEIKQLGGFNTI
jgi:hypothetical protein